MFTKKTKITGFLGVLAALIALVVVPIASAHHAAVTASLDCNGVISFTVQSWEGKTSNNGGANSDVYLQDSLGNSFPVPHGAFNDADNYQFSGTFTIATSVTSDTLTPVTGKWGDGEDGDTYSQYATTVHRPDNCKVTPTLSTSASGPVAVGAAIHDTAHVSGSNGTPTGTVTFQVFAPGDTSCATPLTPAPGSGTLNGSGDATSGDYTTAAVGTYNWIAHYSGDNHYVAVDGTCNAANESSTVTKATPTLSTIGSGPVTVGSPIHDSAHVSGTSGTPTGTVTFQVFAPGDTTCAHPLTPAPTSGSLNGSGRYDVRQLHDGRGGHVQLDRALQRRRDLQLGRRCVQRGERVVDGDEGDPGAVDERHGPGHGGLRDSRHRPRVGHERDADRDGHLPGVRAG